MTEKTSHSHNQNQNICIGIVSIIFFRGFSKSQLLQAFEKSQIQRFQHLKYSKYEFIAVKFNEIHLFQLTFKFYSSKQQKQHICNINKIDLTIKKNIVCRLTVNNSDKRYRAEQKEKKIINCGKNHPYYAKYHLFVVRQLNITPQLAIAAKHRLNYAFHNNLIEQRRLLKQKK